MATEDEEDRAKVFRAQVQNNLLQQEARWMYGGFWGAVMGLLFVLLLGIIAAVL